MFQVSRIQNLEFQLDLFWIGKFKSKQTETVGRNFSAMYSEISGTYKGRSQKKQNSKHMTQAITSKKVRQEKSDNLAKHSNSSEFQFNTEC